MSRKKKPIRVYSQAVIETQHVFTENDQVYIKETNLSTSSNNEMWSPIQFKWVSVGKVQDCLVLE
ncbi:hypothetical protein QSV08_06195 [Maribacter sp. BPC-D8]|uniref:hypothetical protein n=1 Tax=Maribacter sp. BPC-D8 TaxID=3053613 RepID=UPI002B4946AC|nr:hypothetical protein [Maribacter sp. BPC-D8]WRI30833.1 hypothetical protein QSV08_06195 [Maribacter sp. BPC-D8]